MIAITSPATPQPASLLPRIVRPRRPRSPKAAPGAHRHHHSREKSDLVVERQHLLATLHLSKSAVTVFPTPRQQTPATPKSP